MSQSRPLPKEGHFTGHADLRKVRDEKYLWLWSKAIYRVTNDPDDPLTFHKPSGVMIRPPDVFESDMGTVPRLVRLFISKDRFLDSYIIHDAGYEEGGFRVSSDGAAFCLVHVSRDVVDRQLRDCIKAEGGNKVTRNTIYRAVRAGGKRIWDKRHQEK
jgi:hypothetical protein